MPSKPSTRKLPSLSRKALKGRIHDIAVVSPLLAGVIAPLSVLFDIPALTEKWYSRDGTPASDPKASLILSGISLAFCVVANALLLVRFSTVDEYRRIHYVIPLSVACWFIKVAVNLTNLVVFGILTRNQSSYSYLEGFWCAVVSLVTAFFVLVFLVIQLTTQWRRDRKEVDTGRKRVGQVRISGRHFMLQTTLFLAIVALNALVFSKIENWSYLQGIYFSIVTFLTVGFGDFAPSHTATRILLFPFALLGITILAVQVDMIVEFFGARRAKSKARAYAELADERRRLDHARLQANSGQGQTPGDLAEEVAFLEHLHTRNDVKDQMSEIMNSMCGLIVFWVVGAAIFSQLESWSYGTGLYFNYIFFLSIGYGDYSPSSPAGRVVFIVYSLVAVPVMAAFAVQAVTQVFERASAWRLERRRAQVGIGGNMSEAVIPHSRLLENARKKWEGQHSVDNNVPPKTSGSDEKSGASDAITMAANGDDDQHAVDAAMENATQTGKEEGNMQRRQSMSEADTDAAEHHALHDSEKLAREVIERAVELESIARRMMVRALPDGSRAQILLRADRAVQAHDVRVLVHAGGASGANSDDDRRSDPQLGFGGKQEDIGTFRELLNSGIEEDDELLRPLEDEETLEEVERYRACFAALLFAGGRLRKLEGIQMALLERRPYPHPNYDN